MFEPQEKHEQVYAVCRFQAIHAHQRGQVRQRDFAVVRVVRSEEAAKEEVERLNAMNRGKGSIYFYQETRMDRAEG